MKVLFFAQCRQAAGCPDHVLEVKGPLTEAEFWRQLTGIFPDLAVYRKTARLARNESYLEPGALLQPGDEIAVIPPVSGG